MFADYTASLLVVASFSNSHFKHVRVSVFLLVMIRLKIERCFSIAIGPSLNVVTHAELNSAGVVDATSKSLKKRKLLTMALEEFHRENTP